MNYTKYADELAEAADAFDEGIDDNLEALRGGKITQQEAFDANTELLNVYQARCAEAFKAYLKGSGRS